MILTGDAIQRAIQEEKIIIQPFTPSQLGPNSYDFRLGRRCKIYHNRILDCAVENETEEILIGDDGLLLDPERLYLFNSEEVIGSSYFVPIIRGRSSIGRLGIFIHITADLIDIGSVNQLTLQVHSVLPTRLYPGMLIGQVTFWHVYGNISQYYQGKYKLLTSPAPSLSFMDKGSYNGRFRHNHANGSSKSNHSA